MIPTAKAAFQVLEGTAVRVNEDSNKPLLELFENYETYVKAWNPERETEYGLFRIPIQMCIRDRYQNLQKEF